MLYSLVSVYNDTKHGVIANFHCHCRPQKNDEAFAVVPAGDSGLEDMALNITITFNNVDIQSHFIDNVFTYKANPEITNIQPTELLDA